MKIIISDKNKRDDTLTLLSYGDGNVAIFNTVNEEQSCMVIVTLSALRHSIQCLLESKEKE